MSRVLVISPAPSKGGAEGYALTIALGARERQWDVHMALPITPGTETMRADLAKAAIPVTGMPCPDDYDTGVPAPREQQLLAAAQIARMLWRVSPDVVHLTTPWPSFALSAELALALTGIPTVVVFQLVAEPVFLATKPVVYRLMRRRHRAWVTVSHHGRGLICSAVGLSCDQVEVIHNGAPTRSGPEGSPDAARGSVRSELGVASGSRLVISVGRLHEQKGHRDLIVACQEPFERDADVHLLIAGEGGEEQALRAQAREAGIANRVHFLGRRDDVPRLLDASDIFAFASRFEGLPFSVVEAMTRGLAIVSTRFPGAEEIIRDRHDGLLVPVGDVAALAEGLATLLDEPQTRTHLGESARLRAESFSEREMLERTIALLASARAARPRRFAMLARRNRFRSR